MVALRGVKEPRRSPDTECWGGQPVSLVGLAGKLLWGDSVGKTDADRVVGRCWLGLEPLALLVCYSMLALLLGRSLNNV